MESDNSANGKKMERIELKIQNLIEETEDWDEQLRIKSGWAHMNIEEIIFLVENHLRKISRLLSGLAKHGASWKVRKDYENWLEEKNKLIEGAKS